MSCRKVSERLGWIGISFTHPHSEHIPSLWRPFQCCSSLAISTSAERELTSFSLKVVCAHDADNSIINVLGLGVYVTSFMKDFFCVPRPLVPPVTRLSAYPPFYPCYAPLTLFHLDRHRKSSFRIWLSFHPHR